MTAITEFRPGLFLTEVQLPDFAVRGAVIIGTKRAVVWDSLSHPRDMQPVLPLLAKKDWTLVYTHADWDHVWGTAGLAYSGQPLIGHAHCSQRFAEEAPLELRDKQTAEPGAWNDVILIPPSQTFAKELSLDLGAITLHLQHLPGHTLDCIVGFIPEWGILLAGDTVETPLPVINANSPLEKWSNELQWWADDSRVQHVIPAHGKIGGRELLQQNIAYLQNLRTSQASSVPADLDNFYRETHQSNLLYAKLTAQ